MSEFLRNRGGVATTQFTPPVERYAVISGTYHAVDGARALWHSKCSKSRHAPYACGVALDPLAVGLFCIGCTEPGIQRERAATDRQLHVDSRGTHALPRRHVAR